MAITVKNNKSDKELAGHIEKDGKIILNAGATTGAKASEFKFNDLYFPIPGSNLKVKLKPQDSTTFDVPDNSIMGIALRSIKNELTTEDGGDTPVENIVYLSFDAGTGVFTSDSTYEDISKMTGNIKMYLYVNREEEQILFELNTIDGVTDLMRGKFQFYTDANDGDAIIVPSDILFYHTPVGDDDTSFVVVLTKDNEWFISSEDDSEFDEDNSVFEILYTNNQLSIEKIQQGLDTSGKKYIVFSQSALEHLISLLSDLGCTEYQIQEIYPDDASVNLNFNIQSISLGEYMIPYGNVVYTSQDSFLNNAGSTYVYTNILPFLNLDLYNKEKFVQLNINVGDDEISLVDTDFVLPETIDAYDAEFSFDSSYNVSVTPSVTSVATDKFTKLASGIDGDTYKSLLPRTAYTETLDSDLFIVLPDGNTTTVPSGTVISRYYTTFFAGNDFENPYDGIIWYGDSKWNIGLKLSD